MKTIDVNIQTPVVNNNVQLISKIGSNLGKQFLKVEVRHAWRGGQKGFEEDKAAIESGEKKGFILNRSPRRLLAKNFLIAGTILATDPVDGEIGIAVNPKEDGSCDLFLPINESTLRSMEKTTAEAVGEAIRGEKDHFFLDGKSLARILNDAMRREISYLEEINTSIQKMIVTLKGDIADNDNKAKMIQDNWINSAMTPDVDVAGGKAIITAVATDE